MRQHLVISNTPSPMVIVARWHCINEMLDEVFETYHFQKRSPGALNTFARLPQVNLWIPVELLKPSQAKTNAHKRYPKRFASNWGTQQERQQSLLKRKSTSVTKRNGGWTYLMITMLILMKHRPCPWLVPDRHSGECWAHLAWVQTHSPPLIPFEHHFGLEGCYVRWAGLVVLL